LADDVDHTPIYIVGLKGANFRDFKDFDDFEAVFHQIFMGSRCLGFTRSGALTVFFAHALNALRHLDSRFLQGASWPLFYIMHTLLLSMN
jgi:succinate dehydrogenase/fumarate reductase cytochrome b subunit